MLSSSMNTSHSISNRSDSLKRKKTFLGQTSPGVPALLFGHVCRLSYRLTVACFIPDQCVLLFDQTQFASIMEVLGNEALGKIIKLVDETKFLLDMECKTFQGKKAKPPGCFLNILSVGGMGKDISSCSSSERGYFRCKLEVIHVLITDAIWHRDIKIHSIQHFYC